jgi:3',5'-cyclic AMP phosphodiesterase CpdA
MDDFKPFLQIVHISDLHVSDPKSPTAVGLRGWIRRLRRFLPGSIVRAIEDGVAPHDQLAVGLFGEFLKELTSPESGWSECKTWVVDSGDLTSLGDNGSLDLGQQYLDELKQVCPELAAIYGNHDAWPGKFPLWANASDFINQQANLRARQYTVAAPRLALETTIPHNLGSVQLYFMDSIWHDWWSNTWALGQVTNPQLEAFRELVSQNYNEDKHDFRILVVHHPVNYPPPRPARQMVLKNDNAVARELDTPTANGAYPLAHLLLSGHTHFLFPAHGDLKSQPNLQRGLGDDQCQFVVGTLMQLDRFNKREGWPHQCEVLRLYYSESEPSRLVVERLLAARQSGLAYRGSGFGPYGFVPVPSANEIGEEMTFTLQ